MPEPRHRTEPRDEAARDGTWLTIGKLAKLAEVSTDTLRFYEDESLLIPAGKTEAGYRLYGQDAVRRLDFIKHAQHCGMTLSEIRQLLELRADDSSCCSDVRSLAIRKKLQLEHKIKTMQAMSQALSELIDICTAEDQPLDDCPILAALESSIAKQNHDPH
ncbi:MAG: heavy metal-responsive transcriptional regulator [Burkholderiaceae bacterium]|nr:MAG: heavy metal-responsive transcriptional regulator [Burkholderiaceae bacterium]TBR76139.1 MAG: heavy metal-responsive transcriptional regulator [Burkholderiaceae bacterium]